MTITRRQHYVWRHYLSAWENNGKISVIRADGSSFETNSLNIAVEKDFYRMPVLSRDDESFILQFINKSIENQMLKNLAIGWLEDFSITSRLRRVLNSKNIDDPEINKILDQFEIQAEESLHSNIEGGSVNHLENFRNGKTNDWQNDDDAMDIAFFLSLQHFRTKKMQDQSIKIFPEGTIRDHASKAWPILRLIFATNVGWSIYSERINWRIRVLKATEKLKFITSDQPTQNLKSGKEHNDFALFYPVSPHSAIILERKNDDSVVSETDDLTDLEVSKLNKLTFKNSHDQFFGFDMDYLKKIYNECT